MDRFRRFDNRDFEPEGGDFGSSDSEEIKLGNRGSSNGYRWGIGILSATLLFVLGLGVSNRYHINRNEEGLVAVQDSIRILNTNYATLRDSVDALDDSHAVDSKKIDSLEGQVVSLGDELSKQKLTNENHFSQLYHFWEGSVGRDNELGGRIDTLGLRIDTLKGDLDSLDQRVSDLENPPKVSYVDTAAVLANTTYDLHSRIAVDVDGMIVPHNDSLGGTDGGFVGYFFRTWNPLDELTKDGKITKGGEKDLKKYLASTGLNRKVDSLVYDIAFDSTKSISDSAIKRISSEVYQEVLKDTKYKERGIMHSEINK